VDPSKLPLHPKPTATNSPTLKLVTPKPTTLVLNENISSLNQKLQALAVKYPKLQAGALFIDLDNGAYANFRGDTIFAAASTIKIPILVAFFEDVDAGKIRLDETLVATKDVLASGSGDMQYLGLNKTYTALETATKMNVISDNTATNMLIKRMGGKKALNQRFQAWGLTSTVINNPLPDLEGTNTTSPRDLVTILGKVNQGELLSLRSRDRLLNIMQETRTRTLLPQGIEKSADIAHKTGDIGSMLADAGIIDMPNGKRYLGAVMVKRPHNDSNARTLIQQISRTAYQHFKWYQTQPAAKPQPVAQSSPSPSPVVSPSPGN
jgi:beta-lactamase class A